MTLRSAITCGSGVPGVLVTLAALTLLWTGKSGPVGSGAGNEVASVPAPATAGGGASKVPPVDAIPAPVETNATKRGFLMGFTSWPHTATAEAVQGTYAFIGTNADLIVEHLDDGVPWAEALRDAPFPKAFLEKIEGRRNSRPPGTELLLSLTPLNLGRNGLAECAGNGQRPPLPEELKGRPFDDPQLVRAYANYCRRMVEFQGLEPRHDRALHRRARVGRNLRRAHRLLSSADRRRRRIDSGAQGQSGHRGLAADGL